MDEQVRLTVPERPMFHPWDQNEYRPARAGDRIEVVCLTCAWEAAPFGYLFCATCSGSGRVSLTLTEDPEQTFVRMGFGVDGYGWLVVGETD